MRNISLRSLMVAEELSHIKNEVELIHPKNDKLVFSILEGIGFDTKRGVQYIPSLHRDMSGVSGVGYQAVGEYNVDPKYRQFIDTIDRVIVAGMEDIGLAKEMSALLGKRFDYHNKDVYAKDVMKRPDDPRYYSKEELLDLGFSDDSSEDEDDDTEVEDGYEMIKQQIKGLVDIRKRLRGE